MIVLTSAYYKIPYDGNLIKKIIAKHIKWEYMYNEKDNKFYLESINHKLAKWIYNTTKYEVNNGCTKLIKAIN